MAGGRPRKLTCISSGKVGKEVRAERKAQERKLKLQRDDLEPPAFLEDAGKTEFERVLHECEKIDILDNLDLTTLAIYAHAWEQYMMCAEMIKKYGVTGIRENAYGQYEVVSPYVTAQEKYAEQIMNCSSKLGLATTDRLKLIVPTKEEDRPENKFLKYAK